MKKPFICNRIIMEKFRQDQNHYLHSKLTEAKTLIKNQVPESLNYFNTHFTGYKNSEHPCKAYFFNIIIFILLLLI